MAYDLRKDLLQAKTSIDKLLKMADTIYAMNALCTKFEKQESKHMDEVHRIGSIRAAKGEAKTQPLKAYEEDFMFDVQDFLGEFDFDFVPGLVRYAERMCKKYAKLQAKAKYTPEAR